MNTFRGLLAGIGIVKGQLFEPDAKTKALLEKAGQVGFKIAAAVSFDYRPVPRIFSDRNWEQVSVGISPVFEGETYKNAEASIAFFHKAYSTSKAMRQQLRLGIKISESMRTGQSN
jgi:hypothetical protein